MNQRNKGILTVVSGFSGAGKGTIMKELLRQYPKEYALSVSATTRAPRPGETEGEAYFFRTREVFEQMIDQDALIEYAQYVGNYYGTPRNYVEEQLAAGKNVILEIEIQGALKVKEKFPDTLFLFVTPPNAKELKNRLVGRGTETMEVIESRMKRANEEACSIGAYDYLIVNDVLDDAVQQVHQIISNEHYRVMRNVAAIEQMRRELKDFNQE
jgi:guanylate kinase